MTYSCRISYAILFNNCGLLRLDLASGCEKEEKIHEILSLIIPQAFALFGCQMIATKVRSFAAERMAAVTRLGFTASPEHLTGGNGNVIYTDYYVLHH